MKFYYYTYLIICTQGLYWNRPPEELIFLTIRDHRQLHTIGNNNPMYDIQINLGRHHSDETKEKQRIGNLGHKHFLGHSHTEEYKLRMRELAKQRRRVYDNAEHTKWHWSTTNI